MAKAYFLPGLMGAAALFMLPAMAVAVVPATILPDAATDQDAPEQIQGLRDLSTRMTVPVTIDGVGPYHFVVDTAAERTVISRELATRLALASGDQVNVLSIAGVSKVDTARVPKLGLTQSRSRMTEIEAPMMEEANLGASGLLGIDSLRTKRVVMDFKKMRMSISDAHREADKETDEIVVTARSRLGQLILIDAQADGQKIDVVIDTGSAVTIGNPALRARLAKRNKLGRVVPIMITCVTGERIAAEYTVIARARIGGVTIDTLPIAFVDAEVFHRLGLSEKPSMLLGMDVLRGFDRVSVDFANKTVRFILPGDASQTAPMLASAATAHAS